MSNLALAQIPSLPVLPNLEWLGASADGSIALREAERHITAYNRRIAEWKSGAPSYLDEIKDVLDQWVKNVSDEERERMLRIATAPIIEEAEKAIGRLKGTFSEHPDFPAVLEKMRRLKLSKPFERQIHKIEAARVDQLNGLVDVYYGLLALFSEYEPTGGTVTFDNGSDLRAFLNLQTA